MKIRTSRALENHVLKRASTLNLEVLVSGLGVEEVMTIIFCSISIMYHLWRQVFNQSARSQLLSDQHIHYSGHEGAPESPLKRELVSGFQGVQLAGSLQLQHLQDPRETHELPGQPQPMAVHSEDAGAHSRGSLLS